MLPPAALRFESNAGTQWRNLLTHPLPRVQSDIRNPKAGIPTSKVTLRAHIPRLPLEVPFEITGLYATGLNMPRIEKGEILSLYRNKL